MKALEQFLDSKQYPKLIGTEFDSIKPRFGLREEQKMLNSTRHKSHNRLNRDLLLEESEAQKNLEMTKDLGNIRKHHREEAVFSQI